MDKKSAVATIVLLQLLMLGFIIYIWVQYGWKVGLTIWITNMVTYCIAALKSHLYGKL